MKKLSHLSLTVEINKPVEAVWKLLVDWKSQSNWMLQTKVWSELDQDKTVKNGKGVLVFAFTGLFPKLYPTSFRYFRHYGGHKVEASITL